MSHRKPGQKTARFCFRSRILQQATVFSIVAADCLHIRDDCCAEGASDGIRAHPFRVIGHRLPAATDFEEDARLCAHALRTVPFPPLVAGIRRDPCGP